MYTFGKTLDVKGQGTIRKSDLTGFVLSLGVNKRTMHYWMQEGINKGIIKEFEKNGESWLFLPSPAKAAIVLGCEDVGKRMLIDPKLLVRKGWRAEVWSGTSELSDKPRSREFLQKKYNVRSSTQKYRDNQAGVKREKNFAKSDMDSSHVDAVREFTDHKGVFGSSDKKVCWRLPDTRTAKNVTKAAPGRAKKNQSIVNSFQEQRDHAYNKVFFKDDSNDAKRSNKDVYIQAGIAVSGAVIWLVF